MDACTGGCCEAGDGVAAYAVGAFADAGTITGSTGGRAGGEIDRRSGSVKTLGTRDIAAFDRRLYITTSRTSAVSVLRNTQEEIVNNTIVLWLSWLESYD